MSGPGDIDGEVSGDEAAWRDLIARFDEADPSADQAPWPDREDLPDRTAPAAQHGTQDQTGEQSAIIFLPADRTRVIRHAGDPRSYSPQDEPDEPYVPVPLPPPAKLDPIAKAAWTGLVGGPGYLLLASLLHWSIPGPAAFAAVAAFIAGFVTLVVRLGDHHDGDDDGAVL